jgi:hypothetical protein
MPSPRAKSTRRKTGNGDFETEATQGVEFIAENGGGAGLRLKKGKRK